MIALLIIGGFFFTLRAQGQASAAPNPGVVAGGFCTYGTPYFRNSTEAAQRINQYFAAGAVGSEIFHVGASPNTFTWQKTGVLKKVGKGNVQVDSAVVALQHAVGSTDLPGAFSESRINPNSMETGGILGSQALALKINQSFSEVFVTPATGFSGLSLVNMDGVALDGVLLTTAQVAALNGQATLQVREATDSALGSGTLPYGLSFSQLTSLIDLLNASFESCGPASAFAQAHLYQPYVTSSAFVPSNQKRPSTVSTFAFKPTYNTFSGEVVPVLDADGRRLGCTSSSYAGFPVGKIALIERGVCGFYQKVSVASAAGASAAIIFNNTPTPTTSCPAQPAPGSSNCEALVGMGAAAGSLPLNIPAAFVQRSTGLLLRDAAPVTATVQQ
jgi:hypothetical protein